MSTSQAALDNNLDAVVENAQVAEPVRSEFLGVYNNTSDTHGTEVPFRVAIKNQRYGKPQWTNYGYVKSENVAARIYNMYAVIMFGKGAILNIVTLTPEEEAEFTDFITAEGKVKRPLRLRESRERYTKIVADGGVFDTHLALRARQAEQEAVQAAALAAVANDMTVTAAERNDLDDIPF